MNDLKVFQPSSERGYNYFGLRCFKNIYLPATLNRLASNHLARLGRAFLLVKLVSENLIR